MTTMVDFFKQYGLGRGVTINLDKLLGDEAAKEFGAHGVIENIRLVQCDNFGHDIAEVHFYGIQNSFTASVDTLRASVEVALPVKTMESIHPEEVGYTDFSIRGFELSGDTGTPALQANPNASQGMSVWDLLQDSGVRPGAQVLLSLLYPSCGQGVLGKLQDIGLSDEQPQIGIFSLDIEVAYQGGVLPLYGIPHTALVSAIQSEADAGTSTASQEWKPLFLGKSGTTDGPGDSFHVLDCIPVGEEGQPDAEIYIPRGTLVELNCEAFSTRCPVTGQPDYCSVLLTYQVDRHIVETKSFKLWLQRWYGVQIFNEAFVALLCREFNETVHPLGVCVEGTFAARGGVSVKAVCLIGEV